MTTIRLRCSPDADDLFMMRALLERRIDTGDYAFEIDTEPTDALNQLASDPGAPEVVALSIAHYPAVAHRYQLLPHGGSLGEGYGPVIVGKTSSLPSGKLRMGVPGLSTTAWLVTRMWLGDRLADIEPVVIPIEPYSRTFEAVHQGEVDTALIIHEGRLTYEDEGLRSIVDIGEWWASDTDGLPLPLGGNAIRRDLDAATIQEVSDLLRRSIADALDHRDEAIAWLLARGGALKTEARVSQYLDMYANQRTLDYGEAGREGVRRLFERAVAAGFLDRMPPVDFAP
ncbi:MAG: MqnA/MqnD/SBP family protein [Myxococcota bacterium]